jgi:hypothetical protein
LCVPRPTSEIREQHRSSFRNSAHRSFVHIFVASFVSPRLEIHYTNMS